MKDSLNDGCLSAAGARRCREKGVDGVCLEGSPIVVDSLVACRREERACDANRSVMHPPVSMSISEAAKDTRAGHWVE